MSGHTPGPWEFAVESNDHGGWRNRSQEVRIWCGATAIAAYNTSACEFPDDDENEANARLIAAAPDLLAELEACRLFLEDMHTQTVEWTVAESQARHVAATAAIAKATGATP